MQGSSEEVMECGGRYCSGVRCNCRVKDLKSLYFLLLLSLDMICLFHIILHLVLTERRVHAPYGAAGGSPGARGYNLVVKEAWNMRQKGGAKRGGDDGQIPEIGDVLGPLVSRGNFNDGVRNNSGSLRVVNLGGKTSVGVGAGDLFVLVSPGGGGWGRLGEGERVQERS